MATSRGGNEVRQFIRQLPSEINGKLLRGAGRAGGKVIAADAKERCISEEVRAAVKVKVEADATHVTARIQVRGKGAYIAPWLEYGTSPHFISVDNSQRQGMSVKRLNKNVLAINGQPVGDTVHHPGARPHPFLRPALDAKAAAAIKAAQGYIDARVTPSGITGGEEGGDE